jgi:hypothetical protein
MLAGGRGSLGRLGQRWHGPGDWVSLLSRAEGVEQVGDRTTVRWNLPIGRDTGQWGQHKTPLAHSRVRDGEFGKLQAQRAVEQKVDVDDTWGVARSGDSSESTLDPLDLRQENIGGQVAVSHQGGIEIVGMRSWRLWLRLEGHGEPNVFQQR